MRADQHLIKCYALRGEYLHHQVMRTVKIGLREALRTESILVSNHHQLKAGFLQLQQNGNDVRLEGEFVKAIDLKVTWRF